jgi:hypothetical protein
MPTPPARRRLTAGLLLPLGAGFTLWSAHLASDALSVRAWPTASGVVEHSDVESTTDPSDITTPMHSARIEYSYNVGSTRYTSRRVPFADHSSSSRAEV